MFDEILSFVKEHLGGHPALANVSAEQQDAIHNEIANHIANNLLNPATTDQNQATPVQASSGQGMAGGLLGKLENVVAGGGTAVSAVEGGLISSLTSKFGLPPSITGAIAGALPGLLQKFASRSKTPAV